MQSVGAQGSGTRRSCGSLRGWVYWEVLRLLGTCIQRGLCDPSLSLSVSLSQSVPVKIQVIAVVVQSSKFIVISVQSMYYLLLTLKATCHFWLTHTILEESPKVIPVDFMFFKSEELRGTCKCIDITVFFLF
jgi:hypothetical protein